MSPVASVIIPSFQSANTIDACLSGVLAQSLAADFEVIVVDSGNDGTAELVRRRFPAVRVVHCQDRLDPGVARNTGARLATGGVLVFIDSDCIPDAGWAQRLCDWIDNDGYDAAGGAVRNVEPASVAAWAGYFCEFREFLPGAAAAPAVNLTLGNAAYRREVFERYGGFPDGYFPQEDQVFHQRLRAGGARIVLDRRIVVTHAHRSRPRAFLSHQVRIGTANARVVRALSARGVWFARSRWRASVGLPFLATYRFARTVAACWRNERFLMLRRPAVIGLCWLGAFAWGIGFARASTAAGAEG